MIEVAAAMTAEQVIEYSANGHVPGRRGSGGVYACDGKEHWVAVDRASDAMSPDERATWCAERSPDAAVKELVNAGIPAAAMVPAFQTLDDPQLRARGFFQAIEHPLVGEHEYPGWPMQVSWIESGDWWPGPAPMVGQHTQHVLASLVGLTDP